MTQNEQLTWFRKLYNSNEIWDAHTVIKNAFNRNPGDVEVFQEYFFFAIKVAEWDIELETRRSFFQEADTAVVFFSERTDLDEEKLELLGECKHKLHKLHLEILNAEQANRRAYEEEVRSNNLELLRKLTGMKMDIYKSQNQTEFENLLQDLQNMEKRLDKNFLTEEQIQFYDELARDFTKLIGSKLTELQQKELLAYNKSAVADFQYVFEEFHRNESRYQSSHFELSKLVSGRLFKYKTEDLRNETLIYYNHIYSYIFGKLDGDGKFRLTELSIGSART
ncbi:hypothetical protein [Paenibacillus taichungensis]|uniref:hypothetical protein n=1 Tax=Paenibacillus taichungensis TaxID=484184 RepID=UPI0038CF75A9